MPTVTEPKFTQTPDRYTDDPRIWRGLMQAVLNQAVLDATCPKPRADHKTVRNMGVPTPEEVEDARWWIDSDDSDATWFASVLGRDIHQIRRAVWEAVSRN